MSKAFFIDTTRCTGCRGCQVACKQWHDLPAEETKNRKTYENPSDLSLSTYKLVRMREMETDGKLKWLFFPEQCRHCIEPPCLETADDEEAIYKDEKTGAVIFTANTKSLSAEEIIASCPYNIPREAVDGTLAKCDMCNDRVTNGLLPACVKTCPTGTMNFCRRDQMVYLAQQRLALVRKKHASAQLVDADDVNVVYLISKENRLRLRSIPRRLKNCWRRSVEWRRHPVKNWPEPVKRWHRPWLTVRRWTRFSWMS